MTRASILPAVWLLIATTNAARIDLQKFKHIFRAPKPSCAKFDEYRQMWVQHKMKPNGDDSRLAQMAALAANVYFWGPSAAGYKLVKQWDVLGKDGCDYSANFGLYRKVPKVGPAVCAISFAGTDDNIGWRTNFNVAPRRWCGMNGVHHGFSSRLDKFFQGNRSKEWISYIKGPQCGGGAFLTGHSLGGALASLAAACVAQKSIFELLGLYTFGSPGVSYSQVTQKDGECFKGARVYNTMGPAQDMFASSLYANGYRHPKLQVIVYNGFESNIGATVHECTSRFAMFGPRMHELIPNRPMHSRELYVTRSLLLQKVAAQKDYPAEMHKETPLILAKLSSGRQAPSLLSGGPGPPARSGAPRDRSGAPRARSGGRRAKARR